MTYQIDYIRSNHDADSDRNIFVTTTSWQKRVNLYHLIQRHCNKPAYFWHNYKWLIPTSSGSDVEEMSTEDALKSGWLYDIYRAIAAGEVNPQVWCDSN